MNGRRVFGGLGGWIAGSAAASLIVLGAGTARAHDEFERAFKYESGRIAANVAASAGLAVLGGLLYGPGPAYYPPRPVVYAPPPPPVYYAPVPVYYYPAPGYYAQPYYYGQGHHHHRGCGHGGYGYARVGGGHGHGRGHGGHWGD